MVIDTSLIQNCLPRYAKFNYDKGCTLTAASVEALSPAKYAELLGDKELVPFFLSSVEAKMAGYKESTLEILLRSRIKGFSKELKKQSAIAPYFLKQQKSIVNANYYGITAGGAAGSNGPANAWTITVESLAGLPGVAGFFTKGAYIQVFSKKTVGEGSAAVEVDCNTQFKVYSSTDLNVGEGETPAANIVLVPTDAAGEDNTPTVGLVQIGVNNVGNFESWAQNTTFLNNKKFMAFWFQRSRKTFQTNSEFDKFVENAKAGKINDWQRFRSLTVAEMRSQREAAFQRDWATSIFYGKKLPNQAVETYTSLETERSEIDPSVYPSDYDMTTCTLGYKANAIGIHTQLKDCDRVTNLAGANLNFNTIQSVLDQIRRHRTGEGSEVKSIDLYTDRFTRGNFRRAFIQHLKNQGIDVTVMFNQASDYFRGTKTAAIGNYEYETYFLPDANVTVNIFSDLFADDFFQASTKAGAPRKFIWAIDWEDISIHVGEAKRVTRGTPKADSLPQAATVMDYPTVTNVMDSFLWSVSLERPMNHYIWESFGSGIVVTKADGTTEVIK